MLQHKMLSFYLFFTILYKIQSKKETTKTDRLFFIIFQKLILSNDFFFVV